MKKQVNKSVEESWCYNNVLELDQEDELNQPVNYSDANTRRNQNFAYMLEEC
jgi:hypothetical protein